MKRGAASPLADQTMKHPGPIRPEPPPAGKFDFTPIVLSIGVILGMAAYGLCDARVIGDQTLLISLILLVIFTTSTLMVLGNDQPARPRSLGPGDEVPPPLDIYLVWPPPGGLPQDDDPSTASADDRKPKI